MSQHTAHDKSGREWLFGYHPDYGFFAFRRGPGGPAGARSFDVVLGYQEHYSLDDIVGAANYYGLELTTVDQRQLRIDEANERPPTKNHLRLRKIVNYEGAGDGKRRKR